MAVGKTTWTVAPSGPLRGRIRVPGDKSVSHRALLLNALARDRARVRNLLAAEDVEASARAIEAFGARVEKGKGEIVVVPPKRLTEPADVVDCGNSGTSIRLLAGIASTIDGLTVLTGDASLRKRPMERVSQPLRRMGAKVDGRDGGKLAPLAIRGGDLEMVHHDLKIASAQVKSALLLAGLRSGVAVREPAQSRDHTERMLRRMGATIRRAPSVTAPDEPAPGDWLVMMPTDGLDPVDVDVPGDLSAAAFFVVAATIVPGSEVFVEGVGVNPTRRGVLDVLDRMGADVQVFPVEKDGAEPQADVLARFGPLMGTRIDGELALRCLDEIPILAVAAAFAQGETVIADAAELRVKESDRIARVATGLRSLGVEVEERPDGMVIQGGAPCGPGVVDATGDHRIAMAFAIAGRAADGGVSIVGADAVRSSYPEFRQTLEGMRGG